MLPPAGNTSAAPSTTLAAPSSRPQSARRFALLKEFITAYGLPQPNDLEAVLLVFWFSARNAARAKASLTAAIVRVHMSPEVADMTVHLFAVAQGNAAVAEGTKRLRRRVGHGRNRLEGVGMLGGFHRVLSYELRQLTSFSAVMRASFKA